MALDDYGSLLRSGFEAGMAPLRFGLEQQQLDNQTQQVAHNGALIAAKIRTEQAQSALDAQYATDVERVSKSNDPRALSWLLTKYPGQKDALKAAYDQMDDQSKQETIRGHSAIFSALSNGRVDLAVPILEDRIKADAAAGQDTVEDQRMLDWLKSGDPTDKPRMFAGFGLSGEFHAGQPHKETFAGRRTSNAIQVPVRSTDTR